MKKQKPFNFSVNAIGTIQNSEFTQKPLTIFCGPNNSGKTWVMYALHAFYNLASDRNADEEDQHPYEIVKIIEYSEKIQLPVFNKALNNGLAHYFNSPDELFTDAEFKCNYPEADWKRWITNHRQPDVFLIPAERGGLHLLYLELSRNKAEMIHLATKTDIDFNKLLQDMMKSPYAQPIAEYIDWLNRLTIQKQTPSDFYEEAEFLQKQLAQGRYRINRRTRSVAYKPFVKTRGIPAHILGLHAASSTVKSLFGLWFYLEYQAEKGDVLMIDQPELNIHPSNQRLIAHLLARLVNAGIQVVISTHSDYIVREVNNLIMLSEDDSGKLLNSINKQKDIKYEQEAILKPDQVGAYLFDNNEIQPFVYTPKQGFAISTFDEVIASQNKISDQIYHELKDYG